MSLAYVLYGEITKVEGGSGFRSNDPLAAADVHKIHALM